MNEPNLFNALFNWRPRADLTPGENFLTEGFVYVLRTNPDARRSFLERVLGKKVVEASVKFETRAAYRSGASTLYPDLEIAGQFEGGSRFRILSEHKWGSPLLVGQLQQYANLFRGPEEPHLLFICANQSAYREACAAAATLPQAVHFLPLTWEQVYRLIAATPTTQHTTEFLTFMKAKGLGPLPPIEQAKMQGFLQGRGFLEQLEGFASKLATDYDWSLVIPPTHATDPVVDSNWGRVAVNFRAPKTTISFGFLYDSSCSGIALMNGHESVDLFLRITATDTFTDDHEPIVTALHVSAALFHVEGTRFLVHGQTGNDNNRILAILQHPLAAVTGQGAAADQLELIHEWVLHWAKVMLINNLAVAAELAKG